jgi:signal transduction histidine kinase
LEVLISDDGDGFEPDAGHSGFGLTGMRERVALLGGELRIESRPGSGTRVLASVPVAGPGSGLDETPRERALD